jgi:hypothetical protein
MVLIITFVCCYLYHTVSDKTYFGPRKPHGCFNGTVRKGCELLIYGTDPS